MEEELFDCIDGQINFTSETPSPREPHVLLNALDEKTESTIVQDFIEDLAEERPREESESLGNPDKPKRNSQNSIRTINRTIRPYLTKRYTISIPKFYIFQDPLLLLAVFKRECDLCGLESIQL
jgi:hypothetical protein